MKSSDKFEIVGRYKASRKDVMHLFDFDGQRLMSGAGNLKQLYVMEPGGNFETVKAHRGKMIEEALFFDESIWPLYSFKSGLARVDGSSSVIQEITYPLSNLSKSDDSKLLVLQVNSNYLPESQAVFGLVGAGGDQCFYELRLPPKFGVYFGFTVHSKSKSVLFFARGPEQDCFCSLDIESLSGGSPIHLSLEDIEAHQLVFEGPSRIELVSDEYVVALVNAYSKATTTELVKIWLNGRTDHQVLTIHDTWSGVIEVTERNGKIFCSAARPNSDELPHDMRQRGLYECDFEAGEPNLLLEYYEYGDGLHILCPLGLFFVGKQHLTDSYSSHLDTDSGNLFYDLDEGELKLLTEVPRMGFYSLYRDGVVILGDRSHSKSPNGGGDTFTAIREKS